MFFYSSFVLLFVLLSIRKLFWVKKYPSVYLHLELCRHCLIFPGRFQPSIVSTDELNFCVRDGNRWTLIAKDTDLYVVVCSTQRKLLYNKQIRLSTLFLKVFYIFLKKSGAAICLPLLFKTQAPLAFSCKGQSRLFRRQA